MLEYIRNTLKWWLLGLPNPAKEALVMVELCGCMWSSAVVIRCAWECCLLPMVPHEGQDSGLLSSPKPEQNSLQLQ